MNGKRLILSLILGILLVACSNDDSEQNTGPVQPDVGVPNSGSDRSESADNKADDDPEALSNLIELGLTGQLYYLALVGEQQQLLRLDLAGGEEEVVFAVPEMGWLSGAAVSPDGEQLVLSYSAPPQEGRVQFGFTDLYLMPSDGSEDPKPLIQKEDLSEAFFNVSWPLEDTIYYAHVIPSADETGVVTYGSQIERISVKSKSRELVAGEAAWPRLAHDGSALAFVTADLELLFLKADDPDPEIILDSERFAAIDAPLISPENDIVCFSAVDPQPESVKSIWDRLTGVAKAEAHGVPSDWWCLYLDGRDELVQLTNLNAIGLYGDFSSDGSFLAFISSDGVYVMRSDGTDLQKIKEVNAFGTIDWVP